jgi:citronellol/citronellal dehydrogenase
MNLTGKTIFMSGGSRGIGLVIALRAARDGANVVIAAKTADPDPQLEGTIHTAAAAVEAAGGKALPLVVDIRDEERVKDAVAETVAAFGGIDILVKAAPTAALLSRLLDWNDLPRDVLNQASLVRSGHHRGGNTCRICLSHRDKCF